MTTDGGRRHHFRRTTTTRGNDTINGGSSSDPSLSGGAGNDRIDGGENGGTGDEIIGGADIDRALFSTCGTGITVTIGVGGNNDGCTDGAGDDATDDVQADIESITGTTLADSMTGTCQANTFSGSVGTTSATTDGGDTFTGDPAGCLSALTDGTEMDFFGGGEGSDVFDGDGAGNDGFDTVTYGLPYVYAGAEAINVTIGGAADDDGWGNVAENINSDIERVIGSGGNDTINATGYVTTAPSGTEVGQLGVQLFGRLGNDTLTDSLGDDLLNGEGGTDTANCPNGGTNVSLNNEGGTC